VAVKLRKFLSQDYIIALFLFVVALAVRSIPEIKAGIWPIGYDTFNTYVAELATYHGPLLNWLKTANLIYFIFLPGKLLGVDPSFLVKFFGPIFFGLLVVSFFYWTRQFLKFNQIKAFLAGLLIIFQLATLRLSWDLYRNELGLIFLFLALIYLVKLDKTKNLIIFTCLAVLVVLSHELATVLLLLMMVIYGLSLIFQRKYRVAWRLAIPLILTGSIFTLVLGSSGQALYDPHVIFTSESNYLVWRYFYQYQKDMSYQMLFVTISGLFWLCYGFLIGPALYGFWLLRKNLILTVLTLWLLIGTFSSLIFAGTGIIVWERWLIILAFPLTVYAVEGIFKLGEILAKPKKWGKRRKVLATTLAIIFWLGFIGLFLYRAVPFLTKSYQDARPPLADDQLNEYFPRTMIHNSVGIWKIEDVLECIDWLNKNVPSDAAVIVDNRWRGLMLTHFDLDNRYIITNAWSEQWPRQTYEFAVLEGFKDVYLIWNTSKEIRYFDLVFSRGHIGIFKSKPL